jgi:hypothetical protein
MVSIIPLPRNASGTAIGKVKLPVIQGFPRITPSMPQRALPKPPHILDPRDTAAGDDPDPRLTAQVLGFLRIDFAAFHPRHISVDDPLTPRSFIRRASSTAVRPFDQPNPGGLLFAGIDSDHDCSRMALDRLRDDIRMVHRDRAQNRPFRPRSRTASI